jgi:hypothetical protein
MYLLLLTVHPGFHVNIFIFLIYLFSFYFYFVFFTFVLITSSPFSSSFLWAPAPLCSFYFITSVDYGFLLFILI